MKILFIAVVCASLIQVSLASADYGGNHGADWFTNGVDDSGGSKQSPINIVTDDAKRDDKLELYFWEVRVMSEQ